MSAITPTPAQVTEAHRTLVRSISWAGITSEFLEKKAQLIADSEARAAKTAIVEWERQIIQLEGLVAGANAERDRLRAEVERLTRKLGKSFIEAERLRQLSIVAVNLKLDAVARNAIDAAMKEDAK